MPRTGQVTRHVGAVGTQKTKERGLFDLFGGASGKTRMLISANDYKGTGHELTCTQDAAHVQNLGKLCSVEVHTIYNQQCTRDGIANAIHNVASQCGPKDTFIFYFSGHGTQVTDIDGDEVDGQDEAYVCVTDTGSIFESDGNPCVLTDDEFLTVLVNALHPEATCIMISDCCHSGSIADLHKPVWTGRRAISISGCKDAQTSGDIGSGGICTWSMLLAIESMQQMGKTSYSMQELFHELLRQDNGVFDSKQDITMDVAKGASVHEIGWPLIPKGTYVTPPLPAQYQKIGKPANKGGMARPATLFDAIDANHDGVISRAEYASALRAGLAPTADLRRPGAQAPIHTQPAVSTLPSTHYVSQAVVPSTVAYPGVPSTAAYQGVPSSAAYPGVSYPSYAPAATYSSSFAPPHGVAYQPPSPYGPGMTAYAMSPAIYS